MPMTVDSAEEMVRRVVSNLFLKRFAERKLDYEVSRELHALEQDIIRGVSWNILREMGAVPVSQPDNPGDGDAGALVIESEGKTPMLGAAP